MGPDETGMTKLTALEMRRLIGRKELSPVELLESCLARIEALNPAINAIAATAFARARKEAVAAEKAVMAGDELGPLHGCLLYTSDAADDEYNV